MKKQDLIKCFTEDKANPKLKNTISKIVDKLNKVSNIKIFAGVEESSFYVIDSKYYIFCGRKSITIEKEQQDPWLPDYYIISGGNLRRKSYCYNSKQLENDINQRLF